MPQPQDGGLSTTIILSAFFAIFGAVLGKLLDVFVEFGPKQGRLKSLRGFYKGTIKQGQRTDLGTLKLTTRGKSKISGELTVKYENADGSYSQELCRVKVKGYLRYDTLVILEYQSVDTGIKQAGTILLNYDSNKHLIGHYMPYFEPIPSDRKSKDFAQKISFIPSTKQEADNFLNKFTVH